MKKKLLVYLLIVSILSTLVSFIRIENVFAEDENLLLWYKLNETEGTIALDSSGNGNDGILEGGASWIEGINGNCLNLDGSDDYVVMPDNILDGVSDLTISSFTKLDSSATPPQWLATFSNSSNGYIYFAPNLGSEFRYAITKTNWSGESKVTSEPVETNVWTHVAVTFSSSEGTATLYLNGTAVSTSEITITPNELEPTDSNYIGKPWLGYSDQYFKGCVSDFRLYNRALDDSEIADLSNNFSSEFVNLDKENLDLGDTSNITENISLPTTGVYGSTISWESSDENTVSSDGIVKRPTYGEGDKEIILTATITRGESSTTKEFTLTVIELPEGEDQAISSAKSKLTIPNSEDIRGNITLPDSIDVGEETVKIEWETDRNDVVNVNEEENTDYDNIPAGVITRQESDTKIKLTATLSHGEVKSTKEFEINVIANSEPITEDDYEDYLFAYFKGTDRSDAEQIYFASSEDGLNWNELNEDNPVLTSSVGDKGVRDPFILRSPEGDKFYMVATDLRISNGAGWSAAQRSGSKSIVVWESTDLVNWSDERLVEVARDDAGCAWAPEIIYDEKTGEYIVFWASRVAEDDYAKHRIYISKTRDFHTFTDPEVYIDRSLDVIDATITEYEDTYYRFSKDEVNKNIIIDTCNQLLGKEFESLPSESVENQSGVEGPAIFKFINEEKWCLLLDNYGADGYYPLLSDDISSGEFSIPDSSEYSLPTGARHGTVIQVTKDEYETIKAKWDREVIAPVEEQQEEPILEYNFDEENIDRTILDGSGNDYNGSLSGNATYINDTEKNSQVLYLDGTSDTFAELPVGFFEGRDTVTVSMDIKPETVTGNFFNFCIGKDSTKYTFLKVTDTQIRNAVTLNSYSNEEAVSASTDSNKGQWINIKLVITPTSMAIYRDGKLLSKNNNISISMSDLGINLISYLGKSFYSADSYFKGSYDNFKVYNRALTEFEIAEEHEIEGIETIKNVTAEGYSIINTISDIENKTIDIYISKNNSTENNLKNVPLYFELSDGCELEGTQGKNINLLKKDSTVDVIFPNGEKETWKLNGTLCNNPVLSGQFADPDIDVFDGKYYIYPTTDGYTGWSGTQFHVFSSEDMIDWKDEGIILDVEEGKDVSWSVGSAWAPTIEEKNSTYYFYFCAKRPDGASCIGVATSDSPTGPFTAENEPLITPEIATKEGITMGQTIDPSIFTEDDGTSYMLFGNGNAAIVELNDDMISYKSGTMKNIDGAYDIREAITVTKIDDKYHFTWSCDDTGSADYHINYGTSDNLYGPIEFQFTLLSKDSEKGILGTGHHSIIKLPDKDEYYIAYHRFNTPLGQYSSGLGYHRETCIDTIEYDTETGLFKVVEPTLEGITNPILLKNKCSNKNKWKNFWKYFFDKIFK
jgi:hypothetical protein